ncbi:MAG: cation:proton antiporter [bacterium]
MDIEFFSFGLLLLTSSLLAVVAIRFNQATIAGYLLAGTLARFFLQPSPSFDFLAALGAILLLFFVGLEFSINKVKGLGKKIFLLGVIDLLINFPLGVACGLLFKWNWLEALFLGGIVYISSSAVISKLLVDAGCMPRKETKIVLGILIVEDILMAVVLAIFSALASNPIISLSPILIALTKALIFCGIFVVLEKQIRDILGKVLAVEKDEIFILALIGIIFIVSLAAKFIGLSEAIGAFFIGSAMAESHHKARVKKLLEPLGFFAAALFFLSFGLQVNLLAVTPQILIVVGVLIVVSMAGKMLTGLAAAPIEKLSLLEAQNVGWSLFSRGEFSILIASLFIGSQSSASGIREIIAIYVFVLMIVSTILIKRYTKTCQIELPVIQSPG